MKHPEKPWVVIAPTLNQLFDFNTEAEAIMFVVDRRRLHESGSSNFRANTDCPSFDILRLKRSWKGDDRP